MSRLIRSALAAMALVALVVGVPVLLVRVAGWPLPGAVPDWDRIATMARQGDIPTEFVYSTIAVVVWLAWIQLIIAVFWEVVVNIPNTVKGRTSRPAPLVATPVSSGVAHLFAVILAVSIVTTTSPSMALSPAPTGDSFPVPMFTHQVAPTMQEPMVAEPGSAADSEVAPDSHTSSTPVWVVSAEDTLWDIAEQALGDGSRVDDILAVNPTVTSRHLPAGMRLVLPVDATVPALQGSVRQRGEQPTRPSYTVQANDGMWSVAEALLGDGSRHVELHDLLIGQEVAPGVVFDSDTLVIHPGWTFTLPAEGTPRTDSARAHVVEAGDTLSEIAAERLGDAQAWPDIFVANEGRDMGNGRSFDDPDLILPGWKLALPNTDGDAATAPPETSPPENAPPETTPPTIAPPTIAPPTIAEPQADPSPVESSEIEPSDVAPAAVEAPDAAPPAAQPAPGGGPSAQLPPRTPATTSTTSTSQPGVAGGQQDSGGDAIHRDSPEAPAPVRLEHAALLAAGLLTLVGVRRRQRLRTARPRARVPQPPPDVIATERRLRTTEPGERAARVDVAVRAVAHELSGTNVQIGIVTSTIDGEITMILSGPADLPSPWEGAGTAWTLDATVPIELLSAAARRVAAPCVAFVQLGIDADGSDVLVDLEACGTLAVEALPAQGDEVVAAVAAGLASSPYAETAQLIGVSLPDSALLGHRNAFHVATVDEALALATGLVGSTVSNARTSFSLRSLHTGGEMWEPAVVVATSRAAAVSDIGTVMPAPGHGLAVVATVAPGQIADAPARLSAHADGWTLEAFDTIIAVTPIGLSSDDLAAISDVLLDAEAPLLDVEAPAQSVGEPIESAEQTLIEPRATTSNGPAPAATFRPLEHDIIVRLFGPIEVRARGGDVGVFERSKSVELVAWLATHRDRSTRSAARTALWELDVRDATFANVVSEARRALARLGSPPDGEEWVARTLTDQLPIHPLVVTDAQLVQERLEAARLQPPAEAIATLLPAADLIAGLPFAGTRYLWPDAEGITSNLVLLATSVATELAAHALSVGDTDVVFWATGQGLVVLPGHEELIGLRMRAHARAGDLAGVRHEWESYERVIVADAWSDGEAAPKLLALRHELLSST